MSIKGLLWEGSDARDRDDEGEPPLTDDFDERKIRFL